MSKTVVAFTSWDWIDKNPWAKLPGLPWTIVAAGAAILSYKLSGKGLAIFAGLVMIYISVFGQWKPSMQTLSFILVAAPLSFIFGLSLGIMAYKSKRVEKALHPILLVMQTMPQYAVLSPSNGSVWHWRSCCSYYNNGCCYSTNDPINFARA